jgi:pimeloyl-ACP methyl ester carboxylesterase
MSSSRAVEHHSAQLNGIKQHYVKAGGGPAVMLLHGWPQTWYEWRHVIERLADNFTVVAPDLRGFGYTSKPASGYDAATIASDLAALTAHLGFKDVTVIVRSSANRWRSFSTKTAWRLSKSFGDEVRSLRHELAHLETALAELRAALVAERATPIDLPSLPLARQTN